VDRRRFLAGTGAVLLAAPLAAEAQPVRKVHRIGFIGNANLTEARILVDAFRQGLRELGWVEGRIFPSCIGGQRATLDAVPNSWPN
jgi:putative ABC transport system substrate-binding protein